MNNRVSTFFSIIFIFIVEYLVFKYAEYLSNDEKLYFQLSARYSARISFYILVFVFVSYLREYFKLMKLLFILFIVNHLIHFYFLYHNVTIHNSDWFTFRNVFGFIGYPIIIISSILLIINKRNKAFFFGTQIFLLTTFMLSYSSRIFIKLPMASSKVYYAFNALIALVLLFFSIKKYLFIKNK